MNMKINGKILKKQPKFKEFHLNRHKADKFSVVIKNFIGLLKLK